MTVDFHDMIHLAFKFHVEVGKALTRAQLVEVDLENDRRAAGGDNFTCATQDHMDANEAMAAAFEGLFGREPDPGSDRDAEMWNAAWAFVKRHGFSQPWSKKSRR